MKPAGGGLACLLVALAMTLLATWSRSFWGDEVLSLEVATGSSLVEGLSRDVHPPLYFFLLRLWVETVGDGALALRSFQGLQIVLLLLGVRRLAGRFGLGGTAWLLLALSAELWLFAPMLRYYTLAAGLVVWTSLGYLSWLERPDRVRSAGFVLGSTALLYTDYPAAFVLAFFLLHTLVRARKLALAHAGLCVLTGLAFLPWLSVLGGQVSDLTASGALADGNASPLILGVKVAFTVYAFLLGETLFPFEVVAVVALLTLATGGACGRLRWGEWVRSDAARFGLGLVATGLLATALLTTFVSRHTSFLYVPARTLFALPFFLLGLAALLEKMERVKWRHLTVTVLLVANGVGIVHMALGRHFLMPVYAVPWKEVVESLDGRSGVVLADESHCYEFHADRFTTNPPRHIAPGTVEELLLALEEEAQPAQVTLLWTGRESTPHEVSPGIRDWLLEHATLEESRPHVVLDPTYRALKSRLLGRASYGAKLVVTHWKVTVTDE